MKDALINCITNFIYINHIELLKIKNHIEIFTFFKLINIFIIINK